VPTALEPNYTQGVHIGQPAIIEVLRMGNETVEWSDWRPFPDPRLRGVLIAPLGPGCYDLRHKQSGQKVLFGSAGNVALRMSSLLPAPLGAGNRNNEEKRGYVLLNLPDLEYRSAACASLDDAKELERNLKLSGGYLFST
jgi:hypothetical protein